MRKPTPPEYHVAPWIMVAVFVIMTLTALQQVLQIRDRLHTEAVSEISAVVQRGIASWEQRQLDELSLMLDRSFITRNSSAYQTTLRRQSRLIDSLYMWRVTDSEFQGQTPTDWLFPVASGGYDAPEPPEHACLDDLDGAARPGAAHEWMRCREAPLQVALYARDATLESLLEDTIAMNNTETPSELLAAYQHVPDRVAALHDARLHDARSLGVSAYELARHLIFDALLEVRIGEAPSGLNALHRVGVDITELNAHDARYTYPLLYQHVLPELRRADRFSSVEMIESRAAAALNRIAASRDVGERISKMMPMSGERTNRNISHDPFSSESYIIFYGWDGEGQLGGALQVNAKPLLHELLQTPQIEALAPSLVVMDRANNVVAGTQQNVQLAARVPMGQFFPDYELGVYPEALIPHERARRESWVFPLVLVCFVAILGIIAFVIQLQGMRRQYELLERQREFTARVTHELKTPIAGIRIMAESLMLGTYNDQQEIEDWSERIIHEADRLKRRVDAILRRTHEATAPEPKPVDLHSEVNKALAVWQERYNAKRTRLEADVVEVPVFMGEPGAMRDLVGALLDNALKYRRDDEPDPWVAVSLTHKSAEAILTVRDNGMGVPANMRNAIFQPFVRVEGPHRGRAGGHGLGLSQVLETVTRHAGSIRCEDSSGGGAQFVVRLPLRS